MKYGFVIGTYGSLPSVDLNISNIKHFFGDVPILINDDASDVNFSKLVASRKCSLHVNNKKYGHVLGDLSAFVNGLKWARHNNIDVLIKISRKLLFRYNLKQYLNKIVESHHDFECVSSDYFNFGYMTSLFAMHTKRFSNKHLNSMKIALDMMCFPPEYENHKKLLISKKLYSNHKQKMNQELYFRHCLKVNPITVEWWQHRIFVWGGMRHLSIRTNGFSELPLTYQNLTQEGKFMVHHKALEINQALCKKYGLSYTAKELLQ